MIYEGNSYLIHSTGPWKEHKYVKKVGDRYYYANGDSTVGNRNYKPDDGSLTEKEKKLADLDDKWEQAWRKAGKYTTLMRNEKDEEKKKKYDEMTREFEDLMRTIRKQQDHVKYDLNDDLSAIEKEKSLIDKGKDFFKSLFGR